MLKMPTHSELTNATFQNMTNDVAEKMWQWMMDDTTTIFS
jgi:hypothetical protein